MTRHEQADTETVEDGSGYPECPNCHRGINEESAHVRAHHNAPCLACDGDSHAWCQCPRAHGTYNGE